MSKHFVLVNPRSRAGRTGKRWPLISEQLTRYIGKFEHGFTAGPMDAAQQVRRALGKGFDEIVIIGGDGTNNEAVNGYFHDKRPINPEAVMTFIPSGTGGDLRKTLQIPTDIHKSAKVFSHGRIISMDAGWLECVSLKGEPIGRHFINITSFGIGGLVDHHVNKMPKVLGGKTSFFLATLRAFIGYRNRDITLSVDGAEVFTGRCFNAAVCIGQYFGGGMWVAPMADPADGLFDIVVIGDYSKIDLATRVSSWIYKGTHIDRAKVHHFRGTTVSATSKDDVFIDMDGETPGKLPITLELLPASVKVRVF